MNTHVSVYTNIFPVSYTGTQSEMARLYGRYMFNFLRSCQTVFQSVCSFLYFHPEGYSSSSSSKFSPTLGMVTHSSSLAILVNAQRYISWEFYFPSANEVQHFYVPMCSLYIFHEMSVQIFCPFLNCVLCFLIVEFQSFCV